MEPAKIAIMASSSRWLTLAELAEASKPIPEMKLRFLTWRQARVFRLYFYKGLTIRQIAERLGITQSTASGLLQIAKNKIKTRMEAGRKIKFIE